MDSSYNDILERMKKEVLNDDTEMAHSNADDLLCEFLSNLGYNELVDYYHAVDKWFA